MLTEIVFLAPIISLGYLWFCRHYPQKFAVVGSVLFLIVVIPVSSIAFLLVADLAGFKYLTGPTTSWLICVLILLLLWIRDLRLVLLTLVKFSLIIGVIYWLVEPISFIRHVDSINYLVNSHLANGSLSDFSTFVSTTQLKKRALAFPITHSLASQSEPGFFLSLGPLLAIFMGYFTLYLMGEKGTSIRGLRFLGVASLCFLTTSSRFLVHMTNLNSHFMVATLVLLVGASPVWSKGISEMRTAFVIGVSFSGIALLRPDGFLMVMIMAAFPLVKETVSRNELLLAFGLPSACSWLWTMAYAKIILARSDDWIDLEILGQSVALTALFFASLAMSRLSLKGREIAILSASGVALAISGFFVWSRWSEFGKPLLVNWFGNFVTSGSWGLSWILALICVCTVIFLVAMNSWRKCLALLVAVVLFLPVVGVFFGALRGSAGRIGEADSFNRSMFHFFPLMVLTPLIWFRSSGQVDLENSTGSDRGK